MLCKLDAFYCWVDSHPFLKWCWDLFNILIFSALGAELAIIMIG